jgi:hypothetical protein
MKAWHLMSLIGLCPLIFIYGQQCREETMAIRVIKNNALRRISLTLLSVAVIPVLLVGIVVQMVYNLFIGLYQALSFTYNDTGDTIAEIYETIYKAW